MQWLVTVDLWLVVSVLVGIALAALIIAIFLRQRREKLPTRTPTSAEREAAANALWNLYPALPDEDPETALFLLEESKRTYEGWVQSNGSIETKATRLLGFLAGAAGFFTVFGSTKADKPEIVLGPFLDLAIVAAFGVLLSCLYILRVKLRPHPTIADYVSPAVAISPKSRFHIALSLAEEYGKNVLELAQLRRYDPVAWTSAQACLSVAAFAILAHFWWYHSALNSERVVINCKGQSGVYHTGSAWKVTCEERSRAR